MLTIIIPVFKRKCRRHPGFNPAKEGRSAVRGGCRECEALCDVYELSERLRRRMTEVQELTQRPREKTVTPIVDRQQPLFESAS